ncbi:hypothetical protein KL918_005409 [Ogataea parapolymorpha]|nr:hypothetical protein KL918_005409 [Ogataea parapolymorpha]KAG7866148.1 hypothetical protein KL916_005442 [Ogataea parapolymorpha]
MSDSYLVDRLDSESSDSEVELPPGTDEAFSEETKKRLRDRVSDARVLAATAQMEQGEQVWVSDKKHIEEASGAFEHSVRGVGEQREDSPGTMREYSNVS